MGGGGGVGVRRVEEGAQILVGCSACLARANPRGRSAWSGEECSQKANGGVRWTKDGREEEGSEIMMVHLLLDATDVRCDV